MCPKHVCPLMLSNDPAQCVHRGGGQYDIVLFAHDWAFFEKWQIPADRSGQFRSNVKLSELAVQRYVVSIEEALKIIREKVMLLVALFGDRRFGGGTKRYGVTACPVLDELSQQFAACHYRPPSLGVCRLYRFSTPPGKTMAAGLGTCTGKELRAQPHHRSSQLGRLDIASTRPGPPNPMQLL